MVFTYQNKKYNLTLQYKSEFFDQICKKYENKKLTHLLDV